MLVKSNAKQFSNKPRSRKSPRRNSVRATLESLETRALAAGLLGLGGGGSSDSSPLNLLADLHSSITNAVSTLDTVMTDTSGNASGNDTNVDVGGVDVGGVDVGLLDLGNIDLIDDIMAGNGIGQLSDSLNLGEIAGVGAINLSDIQTMIDSSLSDVLDNSGDVTSMINDLLDSISQRDDA